MIDVCLFQMSVVLNLIYGKGYLFWAQLRTTPILRYALTRYAASIRTVSNICPSLFIHFESSIQTIPYTRFAMKKHEVPKTSNPAVTVAGISSLITDLCTRG